jgi:trk system potassium uptake protein TrkA
MGVTEIISPEEETAERWGKKLTTKGVYNSFEINKEYSILEVHVPEKFYGKSIEDIGFNKVYNVLVLTIMRPLEEKNLIGISKTVNKIKEHATADTILNEGDIMVLYGKNKNIQKLLQE